MLLAYHDPAARKERNIQEMGFVGTNWFERTRTFILEADSRAQHKHHGIPRERIMYMIVER